MTVGQLDLASALETGSLVATLLSFGLSSLPLWSWAF